MANRLLKCCGCKDRFERETMNRHPAGWFCSDSCTLSYVRAKQERQRATKETKTRREYNQLTNKLKKEYRESSKPKQQKLTQPVFNLFIRLRDKDEDCISCGRSNAEVEYTDGWKRGGAWDCGHYLTVASKPELRYNELNAHKQCKSCNCGYTDYTKKRAMVDAAYRERLILKIGAIKVDWLEGPHELNNYTCQDLIEIRAKYAKLNRELENE